MPILLSFSFIECRVRRYCAAGIAASFSYTPSFRLSSYQLFNAGGGLLLSGAPTPVVVESAWLHAADITERRQRRHAALFSGAAPSTATLGNEKARHHDACRLAADRLYRS